MYARVYYLILNLFSILLVRNYTLIMVYNVNCHWYASIWLSSIEFFKWVSLKLEMNYLTSVKGEIYEGKVITVSSENLSNGQWTCLTSLAGPCWTCFTWIGKMNRTLNWQNNAHLSDSQWASTRIIYDAHYDNIKVYATIYQQIDISLTGDRTSHAQTVRALHSVWGDTTHACLRYYFTWYLFSFFFLFNWNLCCVKIENWVPYWLGMPSVRFS